MLLFILIFIAGLIFQAVLPGWLRMILIYPLAFILGFLTHSFNNFLFLTFGLGMTTRAVIGGYWSCVTLEISCLIFGFIVSILI
jgi:hypothetical protein